MPQCPGDVCLSLQKLTWTCVSWKCAASSPTHDKNSCDIHIWLLLRVCSAIRTFLLIPCACGAHFNPVQDVQTPLTKCSIIGKIKDLIPLALKVVLCELVLSRNDSLKLMINDEKMCPLPHLSFSSRSLVRGTITIQ